MVLYDLKDNFLYKMSRCQHDEMINIDNTYSKQSGSCKLLNGKESTGFNPAVRTIEECEKLCTENEECTAFERAYTGVYKGICSF